MECKYRPTDNARSILSPAYRILPVQTTRPLAVPYVGVTSNRGVMESRNGSKLERKLHDLRGCVCVASYPEGRKEGSKTWLTVDHRSHQDTSSLPPSLFLSLRFTDRGTPPPSIILLSRETPLSLSLSLLFCPGEAWWRKSVFHRGWNEIMEPELREARKNKEEEKSSSGPNARRRIERDESFSTLSLSLLSESDPPPPRYYPSRELTFARSVF